MYFFAKEVISIDLEKEMQHSYLDYAMSVIIGRALPDVRDGLKPVHRRILFAMYELNNNWDNEYKKSARIVGNVIGKYHPHGDSAVYDSIVRMAQKFSLRYVLIDGQGNFGSTDGDNAAAMRYTEIRLSKISSEILEDIEKKTVNFTNNYDGTEKEPVVLPSKLPNLLINGCSGIAVGMATNIPPHNLFDTIECCLYYLNNPECYNSDIIDIILSPDFPTGGIIFGLSEIKKGYITGRGCIIIRSKIHIEYSKINNKKFIVIDEIPYQVNKKNLQEKIIELINEKKIKEIFDIRDESDKDGTRIVIELKKDSTHSILLNNLYQTTQLQESFGINMIALVKNQPHLLNLKEIIKNFILHRYEIIKNKTKFKLNKSNERRNILEGIIVALENIDVFINIIRMSPTNYIAIKELIEFGWFSSIYKKKSFNKIKVDKLFFFNTKINLIYGKLKQNNIYFLNTDQAKEILNIRLQKLTGFEYCKIFDEYIKLVNKILDLSNILKNPSKINNIINYELKEIKYKFSSKIENNRKSFIEKKFFNLKKKDLINSVDMVITISYGGYINVQPLSEYRSQKRGGKGKKITNIKNFDYVNNLFIANTHDFMLFFSNTGLMYCLKVWEISQNKKKLKTKKLVSIISLSKNEKITFVLPIKLFSKNCYIFMSTLYGNVKKTPLFCFSNNRKNGIISIKLDKGDCLIGVDITNGNSDIMLFSNSGKVVRFNESDVRYMGRNTRGMRGMILKKDHYIVTMLVINDQSKSILTATNNGFGKRTPIKEYPVHGRGTKGVIAIQTSHRNGSLIGAVLVSNSDEIMLVTTNGILMRTRVNEIREMGRTTQGVTLINVKYNTKLSGIHRIIID